MCSVFRVEYGCEIWLVTVLNFAQLLGCFPSAFLIFIIKLPTGLMDFPFWAS